jgi:hypothetical protein
MTSISDDYPVIKPGAVYTFECIAENSSLISLDHFPMEVNKRVSVSSLEFDNKVPTSLSDILNHAHRSFVCHYKNESCVLFINIDFEPRQSHRFKKVKTVKAGEMVEISTPFEVNPYPPLMWSVRFRFEDSSTPWLNYTNEAKEIKLRKSFVQNGRIVHELRQNRNHSVIKQIVEEIVIATSKTFEAQQQQSSPWSNLIHAIIIAIIYLFVLLSTEIFYLYHQ